ncbi:MAG: phage tail protein, partial [Actinomycetota bacterium]|nr:phage tail protein [Actinomycetota bacterium]
VPTDASLLFALESRSGTLTPQARAGKGHFTLTLKGVERRATWFTDRPQRNAGRVNSRKLFRSWRGLGFRGSPPNAALIVHRAKSSADTIAVELKLRSYDKRRRSVRFAVRTLGSLGGGLRHINRHLDHRLPRRFAGASLFIDNSDYTDCPLGQPQLFAFDRDVTPGQIQIESMLPADGRTLPIAENTGLFAFLGFRFGGDGRTTFALPDMDAPQSNLAWFVCADGYVPDILNFGARGVMPACETGEVDFWILPTRFDGGDAHHAWWPADGRRINVSGADGGSGYGHLPQTTPNVPAPEGMQSLVCLWENPGFDPRPWLGQGNLFAFMLSPSWMPARDRSCPSGPAGSGPACMSCSRGPIPTRDRVSSFRSSRPPPPGSSTT